MSGELVRTALFEEHVNLDANIVDFHGFELPIWYSSISEEHLATRESAGLFDVSHMGFFRISGSCALHWLESIATQKVSAVAEGRCAYTHFLDHDGRIIDDMIFAVTNSEEIISAGQDEFTGDSQVILGVPNASMVPVMYQHLSSNLPADGSVIIDDLSDQTSIIALQGPASSEILCNVLGPENSVSRFQCQSIRSNKLGIKGWIQGTGYTGESGFEIFVDNSDAPKLWRQLLEDGAPFGITPVGLGARDTLRLEKGYLLSGQDFLWPELGDGPGELPKGFLSRNTWETNVPFGLDINHEFLGKESISDSMNSNCQRWWGLKYLEKGPLPRPGKAVAKYSPDVNHETTEIIGYITSGGPSPSLDRVGIGMAYLDDVVVGDKVLVIASPRKIVQAEIVRPPFV